MLLPMICLCLCFLVEVYRFPSLSIIIYCGSISVCNVLSLSDVCTVGTYFSRLPMLIEILT